MNPYYDEDGITIYHGDAREVLPTLDIAPTLAVFDPPFDEWANVPHVAANSLVAFTTWQHRAAVHGLFGTPRSELIWHFNDGRWVSHSLPRITHETILIFGQTGAAYVGDLTDGVARNKGTGSVGRDRYESRVYVPRERKAINSVLHFPRDVRTGVWSKPLGLMSLLLAWLLPEHSLILDPFMGSGTTLRAAKDRGHRAVGIEIDERCCEMAARRLGQEVFDFPAAS